MQTGAGKCSFFLFSSPRAGLATLPGWSILCYKWSPHIHIYTWPFLKTIFLCLLKAFLCKYLEHTCRLFLPLSCTLFLLLSQRYVAVVSIYLYFKTNMKASKPLWFWASTQPGGELSQRLDGNINCKTRANILRVYRLYYDREGIVVIFFWGVDTHYTLLQGHAILRAVILYVWYSNNCNRPDLSLLYATLSMICYF